MGEAAMSVGQSPCGSPPFSPPTSTMKSPHVKPLYATTTTTMQEEVVPPEGLSAVPGAFYMALDESHPNTCSGGRESLGGLAEQQYALACNYRDGVGVTQSHSKAAEFFYRASVQVRRAKNNPRRVPLCATHVASRCVP